MNFKKRVNGSWTDTPHYIHNTSTDTITTLPAVIHPTGTTATVGLKGNAVQNGTPTPDNPIMPQGTGDLETSGAKAGQYKIPISSANTTTPVYLGEVETTRKIKKLVLTGEEDWSRISLSDGSAFFTNITPSAISAQSIDIYCTHYKTSMVNDNYAIRIPNADNRILIFHKEIATITDFKAYLAQQYANGTPVTIWYVLATPKTGIVNEPLMRIGDYADEVSGITIPTIAGANTISIETTLQPSEITVNYKGWHPVVDVHERESGAWT